MKNQLGQLRSRLTVYKVSLRCIPSAHGGDSFCCSSCFSHSDWSETVSHTVGGHVQPLKTPKETEFVRETVIMSIRTKMVRDMKYPSTMESHQQGP